MESGSELGVHPRQSPTDVEGATAQSSDVLAIMVTGMGIDHADHPLTYEDVDTDVEIQQLSSQGSIDGTPGVQFQDYGDIVTQCRRGMMFVADDDDDSVLCYDSIMF